MPCRSETFQGSHCHVQLCDTSSRSLLVCNGGLAAVGAGILLELCIKPAYCAAPYLSLMAFLISLLFNLQREDVR